MVAVKAHQAVNFLKTLPTDISAVLVYGNDPGLISEHAATAANALAGQTSPPGEIQRLDESDLDTDPGRLIVELTTIAMFGSRKIVRTQASRRVNASLLSPLLTENRLEGALVVEAGSLKAADPLRTLFEKAANAAAIPGFQDSEQDLSSLIDQVLHASRMTIDAAARRTLIARLGADRAMSRSELEKLALYCHGRTAITIDDIEAATGDASDLAIDQIVMAATSGQIALALTTFDRSIASGDSPQAIIIATQRHLQRLHRLRASYEDGARLEDTIRTLRPPLHFKQQDAIIAQARVWSMYRLGRALAMTQEAQAKSRSAAHDDILIADRLILGLGQLARSSG